MQLAIITDEITQDFTHALEVCAALGVKTIELREIEGKNIVFHDEDSLRRIKALVEQAGMRVCAIDPPLLKCHFWKDAYRPGVEALTQFPASPLDTEQQQWHIFESALAIAPFFGASMVRVFSFWRTFPTAMRTEILHVLLAFLPRLEAAGLTLVLENEHACNIATGAEARWLLDRINSPNFGMIWDPGNAAKLIASPFPTDYQQVRGRVLHVHVKDVDAQGHFVKLGTGKIDYVGQLRALVDDGYDGMLSLETHYAEPHGGREQATRDSLAALRDLCQQAKVTLD